MIKQNASSTSLGHYLQLPLLPPSLTFYTLTRTEIDSTSIIPISLIPYTQHKTFSRIAHTGLITPKERSVSVVPWWSGEHWWCWDIYRLLLYWLSFCMQEQYLVTNREGVLIFRRFRFRFRVKVFEVSVEGIHFEGVQVEVSVVQKQFHNRSRPVSCNSKIYMV